MATLNCVACTKEVEAQALFGDSIYPHRPDLYGKTFLQCPHCGNYVGTHQDGRPLGTIPTPELRAMRNKVHAVIDEYWLPERNRGKRKRLYRALSKFLGREYHTGELNSIEECERVIGFYTTNVWFEEWMSGEKALNLALCSMFFPIGLLMLIIVLPFKLIMKLYKINK